MAECWPNLSIDKTACWQLGQSLECVFPQVGWERGILVLSANGRPGFSQADQLHLRTVCASVGLVSFRPLTQRIYIAGLARDISDNMTSHHYNVPVFRPSQKSCIQRGGPINLLLQHGNCCMLRVAGRVSLCSYCLFHEYLVGYYTVSDVAKFVARLETVQLQERPSVVGVDIDLLHDDGVVIIG